MTPTYPPRPVQPAPPTVKCECGNETTKPYGDPPKCFECWRKSMGGKTGVE